MCANGGANLARTVFPSFGKGKKEREKQRSSKMATYQIEATIEKLEQNFK
jgi:hypothetical protein